MEGLNFEMNGLSELERDLKKAVRKAPVQAEETLVEIAKDFKKTAKKTAKKELKPHNREGDEKRKAINRKWGHKLVDKNLGATVLVWNSARHFHLIENGHNLVIHGKKIKFIEGKHIMEKTRNQYKDIIHERFEKMADYILKESGLH